MCWSFGVVGLEWYPCCRLKPATCKLPMLDILMSETCWAHKKLNKIASDIKLVFYSSISFFYYNWAFKGLIRLVRFFCSFLSVCLLILRWIEMIAKRRQSESCRRFLCFVLSTVIAENVVSQKYVVEKQRRNLIVISCKFGYSFFILIQNFELLIELKHFPVFIRW